MVVVVVVEVVVVVVVVMVIVAVITAIAMIIFRANMLVIHRIWLGRAGCGALPIIALPIIKERAILAGSVRPRNGVVRS
jgi:hypothetical protein